MSSNSVNSFGRPMDAQDSWSSMGQRQHAASGAFEELPERWPSECRGTYPHAATLGGLMLVDFLNSGVVEILPTVHCGQLVLGLPEGTTVKNIHGVMVSETFVVPEVAGFFMEIETAGYLKLEIVRTAFPQVLLQVFLRNHQGWFLRVADVLVQMLDYPSPRVDGPTLWEALLAD